MKKLSSKGLQYYGSLKKSQKVTLYCLICIKIYLNIFVPKSKLTRIFKKIKAKFLKFVPHQLKSIPNLVWKN